MRVALIAVPHDSGRRGERLGAGPLRLLDAGLERRLTAAGHEVRVHAAEPRAEAWQAEIGTAFALARAVAALVRRAAADGAFPLVLSGNCGPAAHGAVAGLGTGASVLWFDAQGDFNTPETTVGGFLDGMSLATLTGRCWTQLAASIPGFHSVPEDVVALVGARDLDPLEAEALSRATIQEVAVGSLREQLPAAVATLRHLRPAAYLHLDLDVLDPSEGRVNPYAAQDGLTRVGDRRDWECAGERRRAGDRGHAGVSDSVVLLAGATGLVGGECLQLLAGDPRVREVRALVRRPLEQSLGPPVRELVTSFDRLAEHPDWFSADAIICALGTTIRQAGSQEAFRKVDFEYPVSIARLGLAAGARHFLLVSALGADPGSRVFYNRVKGEIEAAVLGLGYPRVTIARPSLLLRERRERRWAETLAKPFAALMPARWAPVHAHQVASVLVSAALEPGGQGVRSIENAELRRAR